jgi:hypothetical protein
MVGPRDQLEAACAQVDLAMRALFTAGELLIGPRADLGQLRSRLLQNRIDLRALQREMSELHDEITPLAPSSDASAAFENVRRHSERAMTALKGAK